MSKIENTNKSLSSVQEVYETSYSYEIKILREKVLYWKRTSEMHFLDGFHVMGNLYKSYMLSAMQELADVLKKEQEEIADSVLEARKPRKFFISQSNCKSYQPVLDAYSLLKTESVDLYRINNAIVQVDNLSL